MNKAKSINVSRALLFLAAFYQASQFSRAMGVYDPETSVKGYSVPGAVLGVVVNLSVAVASGYLPAIKGKKRGWLAYSAYIILLALSPALIAPALAGIAGAGWLGVGWALAPDLSIALLGFISGRALVSVGNNQPEVVAIAPPTHRKRGRKLPISDNKLLSYWQQHPTSSNAETGRAFGVTAEAIRKRRANLTIPV